METITAWSRYLAELVLSNEAPQPHQVSSVLGLALSYQHQPAIPLDVLLSLSIICPWEDKDYVQQIFSRSVKFISSDDIQAGSRSIVSTFVANWRNGEVELLKLAKILSAYLKLGPESRNAIKNDQSLLNELLVAMSEVYTMNSKSKNMMALEISLILLSSLNLLSPASLSPQLIHAVLPTISQSEYIPPLTLLFGDYETLYGFSDSVGALTGWEDVAVHLMELGSSREEWNEEVREWSLAAAAGKVEEKGKGKASDSAAVVQADDSDTAIQVSIITSVLPDLPHAFLVAALSHLAFSSSGAEGIISAVLEGSVPADLLPVLNGEDPQPSREDLERAEYLKKVQDRRRGVEELERERGIASDFSNLSIGKQQLPTKPLEVSAKLRESILRLTEIQREEEEEQERERLALGGGAVKDRIVEYEDEDEEGVATVPKVGGDGEESGDEDVAVPATGGASETGTGAGVSLYPSDPYTLLELEYVLGSSVFNKDSATRKGKARAELRSKTGLSDEQIEGWKTMTDRNPARQVAIQQKHEFTNQNHLPSPQGQQDLRKGEARRGPPRGGGQSGSQQGRGGGEGGHSGSNRARGNKERRGNQSRSRGADRKAVKMGEKA